MNFRLEPIEMPKNSFPARNVARLLFAYCLEQGDSPCRLPGMGEVADLDGNRWQWLEFCDEFGKVYATVAICQAAQRDWLYVFAGTRPSFEACGDEELCAMAVLMIISGRVGTVETHLGQSGPAWRDETWTEFSRQRPALGDPVVPVISAVILAAHDLLSSPRCQRQFYGQVSAET